MTLTVAFVGFGEAGRTFATAPNWHAEVRAYDIVAERSAADTLADALTRSALILSLVTADQALQTAENAAPHIESGAFYFDMNSVAPDTKRAAAKLIEAAGGRYVDVAVMAPVDPARLAVPLLLSGPHAESGGPTLNALGFSNVRIVAGDVGRASSVKMIRSIIVKGIEALTAEMMLAGEAAGVAEEVLTSLGDGWSQKAEYNLERMATHGARRAAEMEEVAKTLTTLGIEPVMTRGTIVRQREMAERKLKDAA